MPMSSLPDKRVFRNLGLMLPGGGRVPAVSAPGALPASRSFNARRAEGLMRIGISRQAAPRPRTRAPMAWRRSDSPRPGPEQALRKLRPFAGSTGGRTRGPAPKPGVDRFAEICVISMQMNYPPVPRGETRGRRRPGTLGRRVETLKKPVVHRESREEK